MTDNLTQLSTDTFLDQLASNAPTPGGGGVAALCGALASALASMVANFTVDKPAYRQHQPLMTELLAELTDLRHELAHCVDKDAQVFTAVTQAYTLPKLTDEDKQARTTAIQTALRQATLVPFQVMSLCHKGLSLATKAVGTTNPHVITDLGAAAILFEAAARASILNVRINTGMIKDQAFADTYSQKSKELLADCQTLSQSIQDHVFNQH